MAEHVVPDYLTLTGPEKIPGLVAFWHFGLAGGRGERFPATQGEPLELEPRRGPELRRHPGLGLARRATRCALTPAEMYALAQL
ncbi:MAG: hypothetical protein AAGK14_08655 [Verrucomicrobiota bacterium]